MSSGRPLGEEAKNGSGTLPAYKKITPEELDKYSIPATVQKYFGPRGLLTALLLRSSLASIASGTSTPVTATGALHDVSSIRRPAPTTSTSTTATSRLNIRATPYTPPHRAAASASPGTVFESMLSDGSSVAAAASGAATRTAGLGDPTIGPMSADRPEPEPEPETEPDPTRRGATSPGAGGTSSAPASAEERLQYQILHTEGLRPQSRTAKWGAGRQHPRGTRHLHAPLTHTCDTSLIAASARHDTQDSQSHLRDQPSAPPLYSHCAAVCLL
jgi:hypothetical protein